MTDFAAMLIADSGEPAVTLRLLSPATLPAWTASHGAAARTAAALGGFAAKAGEVVAVPDGAQWEALVGIGDEPVGRWTLAVPAAKLPPGNYRLAEPVGDIALHGWLMAQHHFDRYRGPPAPRNPRVLLTTAPAAIEPAVAMAEATALLRDLIDTPANDMGPAELAQAVANEAQRFGATVAVTVGEALIDARFPAIHAVGRAAARAPRLIDLQWGDPAHPRLTLVGKGVVFDSGGLNIKGSAGMALMKKDMGGAAHALALARLVMQARLPVRLRLLIPAVENAIAGNAFRPGDVLATRAGLTVEIGNTDAEGRLILADALTLACEESPALLIDFATLTGAARTALGPDLPALFTADEALAADYAEAATAAADPLWRLPLWPGYRAMLDSTIADLNNAGEGGFAGAITAALFLDRFVAAGTAWAHFDVYGWSPTARPGRPKGAAAGALQASWHLLQRRFRTG